MTKASLKKNISSMQVIKTLQMLLQEAFSMNELVANLNSNEGACVFNSSVVSKYINTCRYCGIDIPKVNNKYFVASMPFGLELTPEEIRLIENMQNIAGEEISAKCGKLFNKFSEKLNRYSNMKIACAGKNHGKTFAELFENAVSEKRKIRLILKNKTECICIPRKITESGDKTFFNVLHEGQSKIISTDRVSGVAVLNEKFVQSFGEPAVVFVLKGTLAARYELRENEHLVPSDAPDVITVSNRGEAREVLFSRLLRYDDKCEILTPKNYREEMIKLLDGTLANYGET